MISALGQIEGKFKNKIEPSKIHTYLEKDNKLWVDVDEPSREEVTYLEKQIGLHHLALEDTLNDRQRAKVDRYDDFHFVVFNTISDESSMQVIPINIFIMKNSIVTVHLKPIKFIDSLKERIVENPQIISRGPDHIAYLLLDSSADELFPIMDRLEDSIDKTEEMVFSENTQNSEATMKLLFQAKKQLIRLRKISWPQVEVLNILSSGDLKFIQKQNLAYYRDVYDHLIRANMMIETQRELVNGSMEGQLMVVSNNLNKIMKKLTAITALIMLPTLFAGIYGTNFVHIPELKWEFGFYAVIASMLLSTIMVAILFRQKDWI